ncbi:MAG: molybdopterin-binding protein [Dolichospermum sp.]
MSSGGVSVGEYDYIANILASLGAEIHFRAVQMRPGKPLTFARHENEFLLPKMLIYWQYNHTHLRKLHQKK